MVMKMSQNHISNLDKVLLNVPPRAPNNFFEKKFFDFKTACEKRFFTIGLVRALKMSFYDAHYRTEMSILGLPVSLSASEDGKHDHPQLFT